MSTCCGVRVYRAPDNARWYVARVRDGHTMAVVGPYPSWSAAMADACWIVA